MARLTAAFRISKNYSLLLSNNALPYRIGLIILGILVMMLFVLWSALLVYARYRPITLLGKERIAFCSGIYPKEEDDDEPLSWAELCVSVRRATNNLISHGTTTTTRTTTTGDGDGDGDGDDEEEEEETDRSLAVVLKDWFTLHRVSRFLFVTCAIVIIVLSIVASTKGMMRLQNAMSAGQRSARTLNRALGRTENVLDYLERSMDYRDALLEGFRDSITTMNDYFRDDLGVPDVDVSYANATVWQPVVQNFLMPLYLLESTYNDTFQQASNNVRGLRMWSLGVHNDLGRYSPRWLLFLMIPMVLVAMLLLASTWFVWNKSHVFSEEATDMVNKSQKYLIALLVVGTTLCWVFGSTFLALGAVNADVCTGRHWDNNIDEGVVALFEQRHISPNVVAPVTENCTSGDDTVKSFLSDVAGAYSVVRRSVSIGEVVIAQVIQSIEMLTRDLEEAQGNATATATAFNESLSTIQDKLEGFATCLGGSVVATTDLFLGDGGNTTSLFGLGSVEEISNQWRRDTQESDNVLTRVLNQTSTCRFYHDLYTSIVYDDCCTTAPDGLWNTFMPMLSIALLGMMMLTVRGVVYQPAAAAVAHQNNKITLSSQDVSTGTQDNDDRVENSGLAPRLKKARQQFGLILLFRVLFFGSVPIGALTAAYYELLNTFIDHSYGGYPCCSNPIFEPFGDSPVIPGESQYVVCLDNSGGSFLFPECSPQPETCRPCSLQSKAHADWRVGLAVALVALFVPVSFLLYVALYIKQYIKPRYFDATKNIITMGDVYDNELYHHDPVFWLGRSRSSWYARYLLSVFCLGSIFGIIYTVFGTSYYAMNTIGDSFQATWLAWLVAIVALVTVFHQDTEAHFAVPFEDEDEGRQQIRARKNYVIGNDRENYTRIQSSIRTIPLRSLRFRPSQMLFSSSFVHDAEFKAMILLQKGETPTEYNHENVVSLFTMGGSFHAQGLLEDALEAADRSLPQPAQQEQTTNNGPSSTSNLFIPEHHTVSQSSRGDLEQPSSRSSSSWRQCVRKESNGLSAKEQDSRVV